MKEEIKYYLYKITNRVNGKMYIGITRNLRLRKWQHFNHRHPDTMSVIKHAIDKYGKSNFEFEVICIGTCEYIKNLEVAAISLYNTLTPTGYNVSRGGEGGNVREVKYRTDDRPYYVTGFWFPNLRTAVKKTGIDGRTIRRWYQSGKIGDVVLSFTRNYSQPLYVAGFWFPSTKVASEKLVMKSSTIRQRISRGTLEQNLPEKKYRKGENHPFKGKKGGLCINSKACIIEGEQYSSLTEAVTITGYSESFIRKRMKAEDPNFKFKEEK